MSARNVICEIIGIFVPSGKWLAKEGDVLHWQVGTQKRAFVFSVSLKSLCHLDLFRL